MVSEDSLNILYESIGANGPPGVVAANLSPKGMVGRIKLVNHCFMLNIEAVGFMVSEKIF